MKCSPSPKNLRKRTSFTGDLYSSGEHWGVWTPGWRKLWPSLQLPDRINTSPEGILTSWRRLEIMTPWLEESVTSPLAPSSDRIRTSLAGITTPPPPRRGLGDYISPSRENCELFVPCSVSLLSWPLQSSFPEHFIPNSFYPKTCYCVLSAVLRFRLLSK